MTTLQRPRPSTPADSPRGVNLLNHPFLNKGTAFTDGERTQLGLHGLLPTQVESLDQHVVRAYEAYRRKDDDLKLREWGSRVAIANGRAPRAGPLGQEV